MLLFFYIFSCLLLPLSSRLLLRPGLSLLCTWLRLPLVRPVGVCTLSRICAEAAKSTFAHGRRPVRRPTARPTDLGSEHNVHDAPRVRDSAVALSPPIGQVGGVERICSENTQELRRVQALRSPKPRGHTDRDMLACRRELAAPPDLAHVWRRRHPRRARPTTVRRVEWEKARSQNSTAQTSAATLRWGPQLVHAAKRSLQQGRHTPRQQRCP